MEKSFEAKTIVTKMYCECGGEMIPNGYCLDTYPPRYFHTCNKCENIEVATAFLGVLELSKLKQVDIEQQYSFSDINVTKRNDVTLNIDLSSIME